MGIARSTYYDRPEHLADETAIVEAMFEVCDKFESYGYRRVGAALRQHGLVVNHKKIRRLMREHKVYAAEPVSPVVDVEGDIDALPMWAGQGVGLVKKSSRPQKSFARSMSKRILYSCD